MKTALLHRATIKKKRKKVTAVKHQLAMLASSLAG